MSAYASAFTKQICLLITVICLVGCGTNDLYEDHTLLVSCYLFANQPIRAVKLEVINKESEVGKPQIESATIREIQTNRTTRLVLADLASSLYEADDQQFVPQSGYDYLLTVRYGSQTATARTTLPRQIRRIRFDPTRGTGQTLPLRPNWIQPLRDSLTQPNSFYFANLLVVNWQNETRQPYAFAIRHLETEKVPVPRIDPLDTVLFANQISSTPTQGEQLLIRFSQIAYFGEHELVAYSLSADYAELFAESNLGLPRLNNPYSNIHRGVGIFAGFATDTIPFCAIGQDADGRSFCQ